jgi:hypothetical protein
MRKIVLSFGSFIVGAICGSLAFSLVHTTARVQAAQQLPQGQALPPSTISMPAAIPVVPPLQYFGHASTVGGAAQQLDGFSCEGCTVTVGVLTYGGGAFNFSNTKIPAGVPIVLTGAARNTLTLLQLTGAIPKPAPPRSVPLPGGPIIRADMEIKAQPNITFVSLEGVKK